MTAGELRSKLAREYGDKMEDYPKTLEVDAETYGFCCQAVFDWIRRRYGEFYVIEPGVVEPIMVHLGKSGGLMFKNVELILKQE